MGEKDIPVMFVCHHNSDPTSINETIIASFMIVHYCAVPNCIDWQEQSYKTLPRHLKTKVAAVTEAAGYLSFEICEKYFLGKKISPIPSLNVLAIPLRSSL